MSMSTNLQTIVELLPKLSDQELQELRVVHAFGEVKRREAAPVVEQAFQELRGSGVLPTPKATANEPSGFDQWQNPAGNKSKMYLYGDKVFHQETGRVYESNVQGLNSAEPGNNPEAWTDVTDVLFPPPSDETEEGKSKATWDTDLDYRVGDHVVYADHEYEVLKAHHADPGKTPDKTPELYTPVKED